MTPTGNASRKRQSRPTIGLLIGRLGEIGYAANVWPGIADAAAERDANLVCFVGGALGAPHEFDIQRNVIYELVSPQNVDGLVVMSGSLGQFIGPEKLLQFFKRFRPLPIVSIAMKLKGVPSVLVDNAAGIRQAVTHLIEVHGLRRIAFLRGPETNSEAEERFHAYRETLAAHKLPYDPALVAEGNFLSAAGEEAVRLFLDERKIRFEAIASANDDMALGAAAALRRRGVRIPEDVSLVGFDNVEEARFAAPPFTTIRQPFYEQGRRAAEMLLDRLAGKRLPPQVVLPTELVIRRSCGCIPSEQSAESSETPVGIARKSKQSFLSRKKQIAKELMRAASGSAQKAEPGWAEQLIDVLSQTLREREPSDAFLHVWDEILHQAGAGGGDVMQWGTVLSVLRRRIEESPGRRDPSAMERLWNQAEVMIGEVGRWSQVYRRLQEERRAFDFMISVSEPLMTAFDVNGLTDVVAEQLPRMGIRDCYLSLYERTGEEEEKTPTEWSRLILAYNEKGRRKLGPGGRRFPSRELVPRGILPRGKRFALMLEPLHFRDESQLGFIIFQPLQTEAGPLREAFSRQISTALKGAMLLQERWKAEETLRESERKERGFQERLRILLEVNNELSRAESVDTLCRRAVELGLSSLGFDRMGIWFHRPELGVIEGTFGTDKQGNIVDERGIHVKAEYSPTDILLQKHPVTLIRQDVGLRNAKGKTIGKGVRAEAAMWDGEETIGLISIDNLLRHRPFTEYDKELLNSFACTLGYLCTRKRAEETLRESETKERKFQERLRTLLEISNELSRAETVDALCRRAVELGRSRLGFDRLGIWFRGQEPDLVIGSFGTDEKGNLIDERSLRMPAGSRQAEVLASSIPLSQRYDDVELYDGERNVVGRGTQAVAAMWDGERAIGLVAIDNLLLQRPLAEHDCEILNLYASTLGYLTSRKRAEENLRTGEQRERRFQERLRILLEIGNELSRTETVDALCRQAVALGCSRLGFDRLEIWFYDPEPGWIRGMYGTDENGELCDERDVRRRTEFSIMHSPHEAGPIASLQADVDLLDMEGKKIGRGARAQSAIWDGEKAIGFIAMDNLLQGRPITVYDYELLNSFASTLGYLYVRKQVEETLRANEQKERFFQERLRTLMEISNELSRAETVDELCRGAVELGRSRLGFDRLGIWFYNPDPGVVKGSFGTDPNGNTSDERNVLLQTEGMDMEILKQTRPIAMLWPDAVLRDGDSNELGRGAQAQAAMWNGEKVIGFISADNLLSGRPITDQDCELLNLFASSLGYLSSRKRAEEELRDYSENLEEKVEERTRELRQAQDNLVRQEKMAVLGQLTATVSHEIRNPLATIRVSATAVDLKTRDKGLGVERSLDRIQRNITRCDTIISELLDYTRMPDLDRQTFDFDDWLNRLLDEQVMPEGIILRRKAASAARVLLDGERFRRVVINLMDNARQAMQALPQAGGEKRELAVEAERDGDWVKLVIRDAGGGIPPHVMPHIFEPLYSTKGFGVGLGLSIVKGIVEQHGGTVEITSQAGRGTTAVVRIPLAPEGKAG